MVFKPYDYQQALIDRARAELASGKKSVLIQSPAGSGKSIVIGEIARLATFAKGGYVLFLVHRKELIEQIEETFDQDEIPKDKRTIVTPVRCAHRWDKIPKPTLIITDETHHALSKSYQKVYDHYADVPRIGFTATPWRLSGKGLKDVYDSMVLGPQVQWLIDNHKLAPYTYWGAPPLDQSMLKKSSTGDFSNSSMDEMAKKVISGDIIENYRKHADGMKTIVYCHRTWFSEKVAGWFNDAGIPAAHADSKTPERERDKIMNDFRSGKIKVLCNVDLVSEGFNVPDCSCVIMLRPTESLVLYIQQSMRCMRYKPGKQAVIIDQVGNYERHGLPAQDREWTLENRKKVQDDNAPSITTCDKCYHIFNPQKVKIIHSTDKNGKKITYRPCPKCGFHIQIEVKGNDDSMEIHKQTELKDVTSFKLTVNYLTTKKPSELKNVEELKEYAKAKGYRPGWVWYQQKQRGWL